MKQYVKCPSDVTCLLAQSFKSMIPTDCYMIGLKLALKNISIAVFHILKYFQKLVINAIKRGAYLIKPVLINNP